MNKIFFILTILGVLIFSNSTTSAEILDENKKIIYIPIDNRPCNLKQTVEVIEKLGYEVVTPPEEFLGTGATPEKLEIIRGELEKC